MIDAYRRVRIFVACGLASMILLGGCASTGNPRDPLEPINRGIYHFNDGVDTAVIKPVAQVYSTVLPQVVRTGVGNFFANIRDVIVALNNLLQGKFLNAASDVGRVVVNSTAGLLGVFDVATEVGLEKHDEDFGQTLGFWGIGDGPYLVLPFLGPSNLRDSIGLLVDFKTDPITYVDPPSDRNILWGVRFVNRRAELLATSKILETAALDPYEFLRDAYLQRRRNLVYDGSPPPEKDEDIEIKMKPRSEESPSGPVQSSVDGTGSVSSILVSGEPLTPAREEALNKANRTATPRPSLSPSEPRTRADPATTTRVVRVWLPPGN